MNDMLIRGLTDLPGTRETLKPATEAPAQGQGFSDYLKDSLQKVNDTQVDADQAVENLVSGKSESMHEAMIALEKADISFKLMMQVRNKIIEAYQEVMRMQV
ncbi:MAG: flagellar hook-basal body complex protein FliE [Deltaproteobacteria bacterium RIFOXYA12_FULL_61_11]|nr:MAG: flagellar hook-basal body complex protein FliE [Deltaproteobacteria bacterium RIFOXYA12_FULL_61_11]